MPAAPALSATQAAIAAAVFGADARVEGDRLTVGGRAFPIENGVILLDAEVAPGEEAKREVVRSFGSEWRTFREIAPEHAREFDWYFDLVDLAALEGRTVADLGCGMGRWSRLLMERTRPRFLVCVDLSEAIFVARETLAGFDNVLFVRADLERLRFPGHRFDFAFSLGVLHHIPAGIETAAANIAGYADEFLGYLYYDLENRGRAFRALFRAAGACRRALSRIRCERARRAISWAIAVLVYRPFTLAAAAADRLGLGKYRVPLNAYCGFSTRRIQQDAYDRFFTTVEHRYARDEIRAVFGRHWRDIAFSDIQPFWHFLCRRRA